MQRLLPSLERILKLLSVKSLPCKLHKYDKPLSTSALFKHKIWKTWPNYAKFVIALLTANIIYYAPIVLSMVILTQVYICLHHQFDLTSYNFSFQLLFIFLLRIIHAWHICFWQLTARRIRNILSHIKFSLFLSTWIHFFFKDKSVGGSCLDIYSTIL